MGSRLDSFFFLSSDVGDAFQFINNIIAERPLKTTGRSGVGERFVFFTRRRRRVIYTEIGGSTPAFKFKRLTPAIYE